MFFCYISLNFDDEIVNLNNFRCCLKFFREVCFVVEGLLFRLLLFVVLMYMW